MLVAHVVPDIPIGVLEESYTYAIPNGMVVQCGDAVLVPFGPRVVVGFVQCVEDVAVVDLGFKVRPIADRIEGLALPEQILSLLDFVETEFAATPGSAVSAAMPPGIRSRLSASFEFVDGEASTPAQQSVLDAIRTRGRISEKALKAVPGYSATALKALVAKDAVRKLVGLSIERKRGPTILILGDEIAARRFIYDEAKRKPAQAQCLAVLLEAPRVGLTVSETAVVAGVSDATVKALMDSNLLIAAPNAGEPRRDTENHQLNADQAAAVGQINKALKAGRHKRFLLFGVTGSGKTEVYLRAIAEVLALGRQALYLVPEIALTAQVVGQLCERFGQSVAVMHSGLATGERLRNWRRAAAGEAPVVVGARSAIFAPLENIGLIIIDEEHDGSYKQESSPRYDVRALAERRAIDSNAVIVAGSATPSIDTYHRTTLGEVQLLRLPVRAAASSLPEVVVEDLREAYQARKPSLLSEKLHQELTEALARGEQAMLFINRRAFARSLLCRDCGFTPHCPRCSVALTYHARPLHLRCHHCDFREKVGDRCASCQSLRIRPLGIGTQKVEEFVKREFPSARIERLDRDVASRKGAVEEVFARVRSGETQVLIGTQMIAKGLDFENVTLVGVIAADIGLSIPDYRCTERTFQLLTQVAGRSGRKKPGRVVVQTFAPDHAAIRLAAAQDYESFFNEEIAERRDAEYPPFVRLVNVLVSGPDRAAVHEAGDVVRGVLGQPQALPLRSAIIYGPAECALARLHGNWRSHVLVKLPNDFPMADFPRPRDFGVARPLLVTVDVDPGSLM
ncbi:MAG: primosomal protein N' [Armatimonadota bacterium]|nr:primosomal protein N' [Armatimonadota bacterium]